MIEDSSKSPARVTAVIVFLALTGAFVLALQTFGIPQMFQKEALVVVFFFCIALITIVVYQSFRISEIARGLAKDMVKDSLSYSKELFTEIYRNSPVPYIVIDEKGRIESMNLAGVRFFNVEMGALDAFTVFEFITDEANTATLIPEYFTQGKPVHDVEVVVRRPDGVTRWALLSLFSFTDTKRVHKGLLTLVDITKQKQIDKAKTEFVSLAAHQLRTPISGMKWNTELLGMAGKEHFTDLEKAYVDKITKGLGRMEILVNDFLSVSKFELGTLTPQRTTLEIDEFLSSICDEHRIGADRKKVSIQMDWEEARGTISSDSHLLHMIVSNLMSNAIKYTLEGGTVRLYADLSDDQLTIRVTDTGIGIPKEDQDLIFSKLFRAANAKGQMIEGTGLGLYIVKEAARVLGGTISFQSEIGVGTTFTVVLPK